MSRQQKEVNVKYLTKLYANNTNLINVQKNKMPNAHIQLQLTCNANDYNIQV